MDVDLRRDTVTLRLPTKRIGDPRWVRVGVETGALVDNEDGTFRAFDDEWGARPEGSWRPALSPRIRVHAGRVGRVGRVG